MKVIVIEADVNNKIIHPGDLVIRRNEKVAWTCEDFDFEVYFDPAKNPANIPEHPFKATASAGDILGAAGNFQARHVRPRAAATTIADGTRYRHTIIIRAPGTNPGGAPVDTLDPDLIIEGDK